MRCTCRRFGCVGSCATRDRCLTVTPECTSPSTPSPASRLMLSRFGLVNEYAPLLLTAVTTAFMLGPLLPSRQTSHVTHEEPASHIGGPEPQQPGVPGGPTPTGRGAGTLRRLTFAPSHGSPRALSALAGIPQAGGQALLGRGPLLSQDREVH